jgi:hypothetical protein
MNKQPFSQPDAFTKDLGKILQDIQQNHPPQPLPQELAAAAEQIKPQIAGLRSSEEVSSLLKTTVAQVAKSTGSEYSSQDLLNFERQVRNTQ